MRIERNTNKNLYRQLPFNLKVAGPGYYNKILFITKHVNVCDMSIQFINGTGIIMMALFSVLQNGSFCLLTALATSTSLESTAKEPWTDRKTTSASTIVHQ